MALLGKFKREEFEVVREDGYQAFTTPFMKVPKGDLSLPYVNANYERQGYVPFGSDNLFPQMLNQMYYSSPLHGSIVDFKVSAAVGGGYDLDISKLNAIQKTDLFTFKKRIQFDKLLKRIATDCVAHERVYFIIETENGFPKSIKWTGAEKVRTNKDKSLYSVCDDWSLNKGIKTYKPFVSLGKNRDGCFIICFEDDSLGQDIYALPPYIRAANFAFLSGEMSYLSKSNIQNSVFPSFMLNFPKRPQSEDEKQTIRDAMAKMKGAENAGKTVAMFSNSPDQMPKIESIPTNNNEKLFQEASDLNTEQICFAHTIDPILLGVRTTGALGNGSDIKQAYVIFEKNVIIPLREKIEYIVNQLFDIYKIDVKFEIINYQIIEEKITEVEEDPIVMALSALPDDLRAKVIENMTPDEIRALANLKPVEGSSPAQVTPTTDATLNDNLKGLSAKENMDIIRIVRDYNKGKLSEPLARTRLLSYGFDYETINEILSA